MDRKSMAALALALVLSTSVLASAALAASAESGAAAETPAGETQSGQRHGKPDRKPSVTEPENAVGKDTAKAKALADAGVTEEQAGKVTSRVSKLDDGTVIYKVSFTYDGQRYSYQINAVSGDVIAKNTAAAADSAGKTRGQGKPGGRQTVAEPENAVGKDAAKAKALADAGVTEEQAGKVKARVSQLEDGTVIYKVHFSYNGQRYSYRIDAVSGDIVNKTVEPVTEDAAATV